MVVSIKHSVVFRKARLLNGVRKYKKTVLTRIGAYSRKVMRSHIRPAPAAKRTKKGKLRKRRKTKWPRYHVHKDTGLRFILFHVSRFRGRVIIGPKKFHGTPSLPRQSNGYAIDKPGARVWVVPGGGKTIPQLLDEGGTGVLNALWPNGGRERTKVTYRPQPYSSDTLPKTIRKVPSILRSTKIK